MFKKWKRKEYHDRQQIIQRIKNFWYNSQLIKITINNSINSMTPELIFYTNQKENKHFFFFNIKSGERELMHSK